MFRLRALVVAVAVVTTAPLAVQAQQTTAPVAASASAGPRLDMTATAARGRVDVSAPAPAAHKNLGQPIALMVVGGAAIVVGAVIGGDAGTIIMIGGLVALLVGLYQYVE